MSAGTRQGSMKISYLILAHGNPKHFHRLIQSLSSESSSFYVHIDKKSSLNAFVKPQLPGVYFVRDRVPVYWGDFSQVTAILRTLRMALAAQEQSDYFVLLSGADYPIQPTEYIHEFFQKNTNKEFINIVRMPCEAVGKPISRLSTYKIRASPSWVMGGLRSFLAKTGMTPKQRDYRRHLGDLTPFGGSTWWALSREACLHIEKFVSSEPRVVRFFHNTEFPDESFFHTIIGNSPFGTRTSPNLTYTDWSGGGSSPAQLTDQHVDLLGSGTSFATDSIYGKGEVLFARKFSDDSGGVVERLNQVITERHNRLRKGTPEHLRPSPRNPPWAGPPLASPSRS